MRDYVDKLKELARRSGSNWCWGFDSCPLPGGLVASIDGYSLEESLLPWMTLEDWGWKAVVAAAMDVVASGGKPVQVMYSVGVKSFEDALKVASGVGLASRWMGVRVGKSDVNRSVGGEGWIDVAVVGEAPKPIPRYGVRPGHLIVQVGYLGFGAVARLALEGALKPSQMPREVLDYTRRPKPPVTLGPSLSHCRVSAASDNSDGWSVTLYTLAVESGVKIEIDKMEVPKYIVKTLEPLTRKVQQLLLESWEDYNLAVAGDPGSVECLLKECRLQGIPCTIVGRALEGEPSIYYKGVKVEAEGWTSI
ncbi:MAG: AIR synthase related protein [Desulfurococcales archaeon]|nr:AIR synthase related protein [Desulfurococcales archaeon]